MRQTFAEHSCGNDPRRDHVSKRHTSCGPHAGWDVTAQVLAIGVVRSSEESPYLPILLAWARAPRSRAIARPCFFARDARRAALAFALSARRSIAIARARRPRRPARNARRPSFAALRWARLAMRRSLAALRLWAAILLRNLPLIGMFLPPQEVL